MSDADRKNKQNWLICGGRNFDDRNLFDAVMDELVRDMGCPETIIHGNASGADMMADVWAKRMAIRRERFPAQWYKYGKAAGPIRNQEMIDQGSPHLVIAFPGGNGTADMVRRAKKAGIPVIEISKDAAPRP